MILNVALKVLATVSHGLMAVKWILAGEPAGFALVASSVLVAVNTQMLMTVVQVTHLRDVLLKLGTSKQVRITFSSIGSLLEVGAGKACVVVNGAATVCLVAHLYERPLQLLPWLATALGTVAWANATFEGVGVASWKDLKPWVTDDSEVIPATKFLEKLGAKRDEPLNSILGQPCAWLSSIFGLHMEDRMLLQNRSLLLHHAFPKNPKFRFCHNLLMVMFSLCCFAVPTALLCLCMAQVPQLQGMELGHGFLYPPFKPDVSNYYISLQEGWAEGISMTFQLGIGKASFFQFCCVSGCRSITGTEHGDAILLKVEMSKNDFGSCELNLFGLRFHQYEFTALALSGLSAP